MPGQRPNPVITCRPRLHLSVFFGRDLASFANRMTAQVTGNPANLAISANSLLTVTLRASESFGVW